MFSATPDITEKYGELIDWQNEHIFAQWILANLDIHITDLTPDSASMTMAYNETLYRRFPPPREEKHLCGQAIMAIADSVLVFPVIAGIGLERQMSTLDLNTQFLRPVTTDEVNIDVRVIHHGRRTVRGVVDVLDGAKRLCASSMVCYMFVK